MNILHSISDLAKLRGPIFLAIGVFDGVHRGHQAVISTSARHAHSVDGTPVLVTSVPWALSSTVDLCSIGEASPRKRRSPSPRWTCPFTNRLSVLVAMKPYVEPVS